MSRLDISLLTQPQNRTPLPAPIAAKTVDYSGIGRGIATAARIFLSAEEQREAEKKQDAKLQLQMLVTESKRERLNALDNLGKEQQLSAELIAKTFDTSRRNIESKYDALSAENPELADLINVNRAGAVLDLDLAARDFELGYREDMALIGFEQARDTYLQNMADDQFQTGAQVLAFVRQENEDVSESIYLSDTQKFELQQKNRNQMLRGGMASLLRRGLVEEARAVLDAPDMDQQTRFQLQRQFADGVEDLQEAQRSATLMEFEKGLGMMPSGLALGQYFAQGKGLYTDAAYNSKANDLFSVKTKWLRRFENIFEEGGSFADSMIEQVDDAIFLGNELHNATGSSEILGRVERLETLQLNIQGRRRGARSNQHRVIHESQGKIGDNVPRDQIAPIVKGAVDQGELHVFATRTLNAGTNVDVEVVKEYKTALEVHDYQLLEPLFSGLNERGFRQLRDEYPADSYMASHVKLAAMAYLDDDDDLKELLESPRHTAMAHFALQTFNNRQMQRTETGISAVDAMLEAEGDVDDISKAGLLNLYDLRMDNTMAGTVIDENGNLQENEPIGTAFLRHDMAGAERVIARSVALSSTKGMNRVQAYEQAIADLASHASQQVFLETIVVGPGVREMASELGDQGVAMRDPGILSGTIFGPIERMFYADGVRTAVPMPQVPGLSRQNIPSFNAAIQQSITSDPTGDDMFSGLDGTVYAAVHETFAVNGETGLRYAVPVRNASGSLVGYYTVEREDQVGTTREDYSKGDVDPISIGDFDQKYSGGKLEYLSTYEGQVGLDISESLDERLTWTSGERIFSKLPPRTQANLRNVATENLRRQFPEATDITIQSLVPRYLQRHRWRMNGPTWLERTLGEGFNLNPSAIGYGGR